jgi:hypothetical protein
MEIDFAKAQVVDTTQGLTPLATPVCNFNQRTSVIFW